jgi:hypothetical protein
MFVPYLLLEMQQTYKQMFDLISGFFDSGVQAGILVSNQSECMSDT